MKIRACWAENPQEIHRRRRRACGGFCKDEFYELLKYPRPINARDDFYKATFGPIFKQIEKALFSHSAFIKKVPEKDRPAYILEILNSPEPFVVEGDDGLCKINGKIFVTDFSSFEAHFTDELLDILENELYRYMLSSLKTKYQRQFIELFTETTQTANTISYGGMKEVDGVSGRWLFRVWAKRMSGEMTTSLGNGFSNLMIMTFAKDCAEQQGMNVDVNWFKSLGCLCKLEVVDDPSEASFCGMIFEPASCQMLRDPRSTILKFGWTSKAYARASGSLAMRLLRMKSISLAHVSGSCPVLWALAKRCIELTDSYRNADLLRLVRGSSYEREQLTLRLLSAPIFTEPTTETRVLFEKLYGIPISDQLRMETLLLAMELGPLPAEVVTLLRFPDVAYTLWDEYVISDPRDLDGFVSQHVEEKILVAQPEWQKAAAKVCRARAKARPPRRTTWLPT